MTPLGLGLGLLKTEAFEANTYVTGQTNPMLIQKRTQPDTNIKKLKYWLITKLIIPNF